MLTGKQLAEYCEKVYKAGWVYWYGTYGKRCTQSLYESKKKQYPSHYGSGRTAGYMRDIAAGRRCADCVGMIKAFFWSGGACDGEPKYKSNNCPDVSANGMIALCGQTGPIASMPDEPGLVVWKDGHIGVYVGDGYTVEMRGFDYDCVRRRVKDGPWTKWGRLPASMITCEDGTGPQPTPGAAPFADAPDLSGLGGRLLKRGRSGADVARLQRALIELGYSCGVRGADGAFGSATDRALRAFQADHGLEADGVFGPMTLLGLARAVGAGRDAACPAGRGAKICDISKYQADVDYDRFIADTALIILRAGYRKSDGKVYMDERFRRHADALAGRGARFGVYFYSIADTEARAREEARAFFDYAGDRSPLFWAGDFEKDSVTTGAIAAFADELRRLGAKKVGCYVANHLYEKYDYDSIRERMDFTWIPRYGAERPKHPCDLWQYTSAGSVGGIAGDVDLSRITGDGHDLSWFTEG